MGEAMAGTQGLRSRSRRRRGPPAVRAPRRAAVCERRHPHRPRVQQDPEGHRRQEPLARRLRCPVRSGLGLSRHADRGADREGARQAHSGRGDAAARARLRQRADRAAEARLPAPRHPRRMGQPVPDDGVSQRGRRDPHARQAAAEGLHLSRAETRQLVLRLRLGAGRSGSRVRGPAGQRDRRGVPDRRRGPGQARDRLRVGRAARRSRAGGDLDDHAVDDSRQSGAERASGVRLRAGRDQPRPSGAGGRPGRHVSRSATGSKDGSSQQPRARRSSRSASAIRSTTGRRRSISATT